MEIVKVRPQVLHNERAVFLVGGRELKVAVVPKQTSDPLFIGRRTDGFFNDAAMAEVAIYSVALSAGRIAAHWQASGAH